MQFIKVFMGSGGMECVRRAVAVEVESRRLSYTPWRIRRREGDAGEGEYGELYRRFRELYLLPAQLIQQAINQGVETGKSFLALKRNGRIHKPHPEVQRVAIRFAKDGWSYKKAISTAAPVKIAVSLHGGRREIWIKPHRF